MAICFKPTYRSQASFVSLSVTQITQYIHETRAVLNFANQTLVSQLCMYYLRRESLSSLQIAVKRPIHVGVKILLYDRSSFICDRVWLVVVPSQAADMPPSISLINRLICVVFPSERKIVQWHSHLVAIPSPNANRNLTLPSHTALLSNNKLTESLE